MRKIKVREVVIDILEKSFENGKPPKHEDIAEKHRISEKNAQLISMHPDVRNLCNQMMQLKSRLSEQSSRIIEVVYQDLKARRK